MIIDMLVEVGQREKSVAGPPSPPPPRLLANSGQIQEAIYDHLCLDIYFFLFLDSPFSLVFTAVYIFIYGTL